MTCKPFIAAVLLLASFGGLQARAGTTDNNQNIAIDSDLKIPGYVLKPGIYTLAVEDQFKGRWVVAISGADKHYSLLAVPTGKLGSEVSKGIVLFTSADSRKQILRGWVFPSARRVWSLCIRRKTR